MAIAQTARGKKREPARVRHAPGEYQHNAGQGTSSIIGLIATIASQPITM